MRKPVVAFVLLIALAAAARAAVPDAVRQLPLRREVVLPAAPPPGAWIMVELDSLLNATTAGDLARVRLVDDAGEPVPAVVLDPSWPELRAVALPADSLAWQREAGEERQWHATVPLPPGRYLRATWSTERVADVRAAAELAPTWEWSAPAKPSSGGTATWDAPGDSVVLTVTTLDVSAPVLALDRLLVRQERLRRAPFAARTGTFRGTAYEQVIELLAGPQPVAAVVLRRRPEAPDAPLTLDVRTAQGRWEREPAAARDTLLEVAGALAPATRLRLGATSADPPNPPFAVAGIAVLPPALAFAPGVRGPLWLVYGEYPVPAPPGLPRERLERVGALVPATFGPPGRNPWFEESFLGATWLRRRPLVVTAAMVLVLAAVAWLLVGSGSEIRHRQ